MEYTNYFKFLFLSHLHIHKELLINENFELIDALLWNNVITSRKLTTPSLKDDEKEDYDLYLIPKLPLTNIYKAWEGKSDKIALYSYKKKQWSFIEPRNGMSFIVADEKKTIFFKNRQWHSL